MKAGEQIAGIVQGASSTGSVQEQCRKCGECCKSGGPALHREDLALIRAGKLTVRDLITIRKGELAHNPLTGKIQPATVELVKIVGSGRQWQCSFYDNERACTIYNDRPIGCRLLKCWDTKDILNVIEKDTLTRMDILDESDPLVPLIKEHEELCPCGGLESVRDNKSRLTPQQKKELETIVSSDLQYRNKVITNFKLSLREELFYFGRPFFQLLQPLGVRIVESENGVQVLWKG